MTSEPTSDGTAWPAIPLYWSAHEAWPPVLRYLDPASRAKELGRTWRDWGLSTEPANRQLAEIGISDFYRARGRQRPWIEWATSPANAIRIARSCLLRREEPLPLDVITTRHERQGYYNREWVRWAAWDLRMSEPDVIQDIGAQLVRAAIPDRETTRQRSFHLDSAREADLDYMLRRIDVHPGQFNAEELARSERISRMNSDDRRQAWNMTQYASWNRWTAGRRMLDVAPPTNFEPDLPALHALMMISSNAGPWWPFEDTVVICDRPKFIYLDDRQQLHADNGRAVTYSDGWGIHAWHGTRVPADLIDGPEWGADKILAEPNTEIRRVAIERIGWDRFIDQAAMVPVGPPVPDPGNPGQELALYDVPSRVYRAFVRVLLCTNGSRERDGTRRRFGLTVPGHFQDPVAAAAWTFGWSRAQYAALEHRR